MPTLHDIRNDCLTILFQKNYLEESDFRNIKFVTNGGEKLKNAAILKALNQLESVGAIVKCETEENGIRENYWLLDKNASQVNQTIEINAGTANTIYQVVKHYGEVMDVDLSVDPTNLSERDIQLLCIACSSLIESLVEENDDNDSLEEEEEK